MKTTTITARISFLHLFVLLVLILVTGCAGNSPAPQDGPVVPSDSASPAGASADSVMDWAGFSGRIYQDGRVFIAGQPDPEALRGLSDHEVATVINLRTPKEMADTSKVAFDEAALLDSLGVDYIHIPLGGKYYPYTPAAVDAFAAALEENSGPVLLHCASGGRASHLWAAYLVRFRGWGVTEAYARGESIGISRSAFSRFLDVELEVVQKKP